jgi:AraC-like DNA-binding protein
VIRFMHEHPSEPLSGWDLARLAHLSPFHFNRVFRQITGIPPAQFLWALRLEKAKRLLLTTRRSITDICYEMGYNSLGSFINRFTQLVGRSPKHLRRQAVDNTGLNLECMTRSYSGSAEGGLALQVSAPPGTTGPVVVGLFPEPIPQGRPAACAVLAQPGPCYLPPVPDGEYYALAVVLSGVIEPFVHSLYEKALRGSCGPLQLGQRQTATRAELAVRPAQLTDPPLVVAIPLLLSVPPAAAWGALTQSTAKLNSAGLELGLQPADAEGRPPASGPLTQVARERRDTTWLLSD